MNKNKYKTVYNVMKRYLIQLAGILSAARIKYQLTVYVKMKERKAFIYLEGLPMNELFPTLTDYNDLR